MTWQPVEPLSRTPWTADFVAAKGRAIIFGVLAVVLLSFAIAGSRYEYTWGVLRSSGFGMVVDYHFDGQSYTTPLPEQYFRIQFSTGGSPLVIMLISSNNPQNIFFPTHAPMPSGIVLLTGAAFGTVSLYCVVVARAGRRRDISGDHRSSLR
ncbi:MAG: hypothetical protein FWC93_01825 [Defluviitaleaceae bacterium]|nr:hypothetical protein [Defluviitaleaceae bacterium]